MTSLSEQARKSLEYKAWRAGVYARDNYICQDCGKQCGKLHAHHIFPFALYPKHRFDIWNGITLCPSCHINRHGRAA